MRILITGWEPPYSVIGVSKVLRRELNITLRPAMHLASGVDQEEVLLELESEAHAQQVANELREHGAVIEVSSGPGAVEPTAAGRP